MRGMRGIFSKAFGDFEKIKAHHGYADGSGLTGKPPPPLAMRRTHNAAGCGGGRAVVGVLVASCHQRNHTRRGDAGFPNRTPPVRVETGKPGKRLKSMGYGLPKGAGKAPRGKVKTCLISMLYRLPARFGKTGKNGSGKVIMYHSRSFPALRESLGSRESTIPRYRFTA